jgi:hypothetical protein
MLLKYLVVFFLLFNNIESVLCQSVFKQHVKHLASKKMAGRGYSKKGMSKAADYLIGELKRNQLQPFYTYYIDTFYHPVNTIEYCKVKIDNKLLKPGIDYLIHPSSSSVKGTFTIQNKYASNSAFFLGNNLQSKKYHQKIDSIYTKTKTNVYLSTFNKLIYFVSISQAPYTHIILKDSVFNFNSKLNLKVKSTYINNYLAKNVLAKIEGEIKDSIILLSAHYDHLGAMGKAIFYGANDNASGTAFLLNLAQYFSKEKPKYTLVFAFIASEEAGLIGSKKLANQFFKDKIKLKCMLNFDLMGFGEDGITIVNGKENPGLVNQIEELNKEKVIFKEVKVRPNAANSDHYHFALKGYPAIFIYTMGDSRYYHDVMDTYSHLNYEFYPKMFDFFKDFISKM